MNAPIYSARNISKSFGAQRALDNVHLDISEGQIVGLIGANGAGKSTLMKILSGALAADQGELQLEGQPIAMSSMLEAWRSGVAFVSQELNLFPPMSIAENLWLVPGRIGITPTPEFLEAAKKEIAGLGLSVPLSTPVAGLSLGDRQLVEIARALLQKPRVLILDEPTSALHAAEVDRLHDVLRTLRDAGVAIVYISHFLEELLEISDAIAVLRDGQRVPLKSRRKQPTIPEVVAAMLGPSANKDQSTIKKRRRITKDAPALSITDLKEASGLHIGAFQARAGEVVGVAGLAGAGVEALFSTLFGLNAPSQGTIELPSGKAFQPNLPSAVKNGVAYFPADRKRLGLTLQQSIHENVSAVRHLALGRDGEVPDVAQQKSVAQQRCDTIGVKLADINLPVESLSGGNQQKVVFARWLEADPSLLLLDDPMRGVDVNAKREMNNIIRELTGTGRVILFYSSDAADYIAACDRVVVFVDNKIGAELRGVKLNEHQLVAAMNGEA